MRSSPRRTFTHYLGRHGSRLLLGTFGMTVAAALAVVPPRFIGQIVDALNVGTELGVIVVLALGSVAFAAAEAITRGFSRYQIINASRRIEYEMRNDLLAHLQTMHLGYFQHQRIGDLMARLTNDLTAVRQTYGFGILMTASTVMLLVFTIISMVGVSLKLTILTLLLMPVASGTFWIVGRKVHHKFQELQAQFGEMSTKAQENFSGIRVVKAFSQEESEIGSFADVNAEYVRRAVDLAKLNGLIWPAMAFIMGIAILATLYVGGRDAIEGTLTIGQLVQFIAYQYLISWPMIAFGEITNIFQQGWASLVRLQEIFDARPSIVGPRDPVEAPIKGEVELRGVSFAYYEPSARNGSEGRRPTGGNIVLRDISFKVPAGGSLAIVGATGSGKSTLVNLIPRLFDPQQGDVFIDGVDVKRYPLEKLRRAVGYVPQETFLFSVPLRENVGFGAEKALTDAQLHWAGDVSQLNKDVEDFPARFDTMIGERGVTLSGGQKQRTAIARAVAKDPRILILDDALSAVDTYTEAEILRRLRGVMRERTSIVVAHRISTVKGADEILVLEGGGIVERGSHQALLQLKGRYAQMYRRQLLEEELEVDVERDEHEKRIRAERDDDTATRAPRIPAERLGLEE